MPARAGSGTLALLSSPINAVLLEELAEGPKSLAQLHWAAGGPSPATMRARLRELSDLQVLTAKRQAEFPRALEYELTQPGKHLLGVSKILREWLAACPEGQLELGSPQAKVAVKALAEGWSSAIVRALSARPLSLTALNRLIAGLNYPSLERRLGAMRRCGQIEPVPGDGQGTPYTATPWLRRAVGPLLAAARWEQTYAPNQSASIGRLDVEAIFLLAIPLLKLPVSCSGTCRLVVELSAGQDRQLAGVVVELEEGALQSCRATLQGEAVGWAAGTPSSWLDALIDDNRRSLELGGDCSLAGELIGGLHEALFLPALRS